MKSNSISLFSKKALAAFALGLLLSGGGGSIAIAASLLNKSDTLSSQKISEASDHTIVFRAPSGVDVTGETITFTFESGFDLSALTFSDFTLTYSAGGQSSCSAAPFANSTTLAASAAAGVWGAAVSGQVVTLTAPTDSVAIGANACIGLEIGDTNQIVNPGTAANYSVAIAGTFGDSGSILIPILSDDQVQITAKVDETLTFTISDNAIGFGSLNSSAARFATADALGSASEVGAHDLVVGTNASNGYTLTVLGDTLTYGLEEINAIGGTAVASTPGTEQFGMRYTATGGSGAVSAPYNTSDFAFVSATVDEIASATGVSANTTYSARYVANIDATTPAGEYSTTLTYTATANF